MPLVLEARAGQRIFIGEEVITVTSVTENNFSIDNGNGVEQTVTDEKCVEIFKDVFISSGTRGAQDRLLAKLVIDAPRHIKVLREKIKDA